MPRSKEDNQELREARIRDIANAALRVYVQKGYLGTQMDDVAKEAGLAKGLVYYYFKNKPELFRYVFGNLMQQALSFSKDTATQPSTFAETLEAMIRHFVFAAYENPLYPLAYKMMPDDLQKVFPDRPEHHSFFVDNLVKPLTELFAAAMDNGELPKGNPRLKALLFYSGVLTVSHAAAQDPSIGTNADKVFEETRQQLFHGVFAGQKQ